MEARLQPDRGPTVQPAKIRVVKVPPAEPAATQRPQRRGRAWDGLLLRMLAGSPALGQTDRRVAGILSTLGADVTDSAASLSKAAANLASATFEQTTAATATSASMEEMARRAASIADTVERVGIQTGELGVNLELAQRDLKASGERTLALAQRVNEIRGILEVINDIADQTNLLALNAAIEAARAGDSGRGFAVVADEVRRLAERSKAAAAQIAKVVEGAQVQSSETVMALEKGVKQMERGQAMLQAVRLAGEGMQNEIQLQRTSTEEVVVAIENIAEGSRSVAATAHEIAAAATRQGALAAELEGSNPGREASR